MEVTNFVRLFYIKLCKGTETYGQGYIHLANTNSPRTQYLRSYFYFFVELFMNDFVVNKTKYLS